VQPAGTIAKNAMLVVLRIFTIVVAYAAACVAAALVFAIAMLEPPVDAWSAIPPPMVAVLAMVGAPIVGAVAFLPAALIVTIAEGFAWRSALLYAAAGGALGLAASYAFDLPADIGEVAIHFAREREGLAASGIAGGLVYWLFAGRSAGSWK
jgi:hypothetical protein